MGSHAASQSAAAKPSTHKHTHTSNAFQIYSFAHYAVCIMSFGYHRCIDSLTEYRMWNKNIYTGISKINREIEKRKKKNSSTMNFRRLSAADRKPKRMHIYVYGSHRNAVTRLPPRHTGSRFIYFALPNAQCERISAPVCFGCSNFYGKFIVSGSAWLINNGHIIYMKSMHSCVQSVYFIFQRVKRPIKRPPNIYLRT